MERTCRVIGKISYHNRVEVTEYQCEYCIRKCVCVCVCVCERERERERVGKDK